MQAVSPLKVFPAGLFSLGRQALPFVTPRSIVGPLHIPILPAPSLWEPTIPTDSQPPPFLSTSWRRKEGSFFL